MSLISLLSASFDYGREKVLAEVDMAIYAGVKYALVGDNGVGKTTLLAALAGELPLDGGDRQAGSSLQIAFLRQETTLDPAEGAAVSAFQAVAEAAFGRELTLEVELERVGHRLSRVADSEERDELVQRQGRLQAEFERLGGYTLRPRLEAALRGLGLRPEDWERSLGSLSGGERRRSALAAVLLGGADVLLLDEPTNHLDLSGCEWLEDFLRQCRSAALLVSHDRHFLDRVAERTFHLENAKVYAYTGNYSTFERQWRQRREQQRLQYQRQVSQIRKTEELIRRTMASGGQKTRQAQSRKKQLARLERTEKPTPPPVEYTMRLEAERTSGRLVLQANGLAKGFDGQLLFERFDLLITRGERIGIIGPNGCGKTSLLRILGGQAAPDAGSVQRGHHVDLGYFDQELRSVTDHRTVLQEIAQVDPLASAAELRGFLAAFGFQEEMWDRGVGQLSGGERARLALMRLIKEGHNTLLLDEPTNHLDVRSREALEEALADFPGTLVVVSHDRRFLDKMISRLLIFPSLGEGGGVQQFLGSYADYHRRVEEARPPEGPSPAELRGSGSAPSQPTVLAPAEGRETVPHDRPRRGLSKNEKARRRSWIAEAERNIAALESQREELIARMAETTLSPEKRLKLGKRCAEIDRALAEKLQQWEKWSMEIQEAEPD